MSNLPCSSKNFVRLSDDRLQAVSSRNMYSEHGLLALIFPLLGQVCQWLMVLSYCTPGSAQAQADSATMSQSSPAFSVSTTLPVVRAMVCHLPHACAARRNSSLTRRALFELWPLP